MTSKSSTRESATSTKTSARRRSRAMPIIPSSPAGRCEMTRALTPSRLHLPRRIPATGRLLAARPCPGVRAEAQVGGRHRRSRRVDAAVRRRKGVHSPVRRGAGWAATGVCGVSSMPTTLRSSGARTPEPACCREHTEGDQALCAMGADAPEAIAPAAAGVPSAAVSHGLARTSSSRPACSACARTRRACDETGRPAPWRGYHLTQQRGITVHSVKPP
jgi:hypothetical protein